MGSSPATGSRRLVRAVEDDRSLRRREDARFLTGHGRYVADALHAGALHAVFLRSTHAHADLAGIDSSEAETMPGVIGVFTVADLLADGVGLLPCTMDLRMPGSSLHVPPRFPLAKGRVRHIGEAIAVVVAESRSLAQDAVDTIIVDFNGLPAVVDPVAACEDCAQQIWEGSPGNVAFQFHRGDEAQTAAAFARAAHVVSLELVNNRIAAAALEPRTAVGVWDGQEGRWLLELSGASVHVIRRELASVMGVAQDRVDVVCPDVGGGFGMKNVTYPEYAVLLWAAKHLGATVRWTASRLDDFTSGVHGRGNVTWAQLALDAEGNFLALRVDTVAELGAYLSTSGPGSSTLAPATAMGGVYAIPAIAMDVRGVFTNTAPIDAYRGAGKPEANYIIERLVDVAARRLGVDAIALRRLNLVQTFPYTNATGFTIDCGEFRANLDRALLLADRDGFASRVASASARRMLRGMGVACFLETSRGQPNEEAWLRFDHTGMIDLAVGTQSNGQGHETSFVQLVADRMGLPLAMFRLVQGDTRRVPRGGGHGGARSLHMGGTALLLAADDTLRRARLAAAAMLQARPDDLEYAAGAFTRSGTDGIAPAVTLFALAEAAREAGMPEALDGHGDNVCDVFTFPNGCHVAEVEVDPETGVVTLCRYVAVDDYGTLLNPLLTEGQVQGGIAQGIGQALCEAIRYDSESGQLLSATFSDYAMLRGEDLPWLDLRFVEVPTRANPMGSKGSGQAGAIGAPQTMINAIVDALAPYSIEHVDMPATPLAIWSRICEAEDQEHLGQQVAFRARTG